ncbi:hypothetical protein [Streptomyces sp. CA-106110]|uniref:ATP-binding protein n=1 Tax=Streptomyces sp. CA-106110 TaxID=3240044 RepID=UPI003D8F5F0D
MRHFGTAVAPCRSAPGTGSGRKGLKNDALGMFSPVVIGLASTAPASCLAATLGDDEGRRGLFIIAQMTAHWGTRYTPTGKTIWTEQTLPPPDTEHCAPSRPVGLTGSQGRSS